MMFIQYILKLYYTVDVIETCMTVISGKMITLQYWVGGIMHPLEPSPCRKPSAITNIRERPIGPESPN